MTYPATRPEPYHADTGFTVLRPRATDAVGSALRHAFSPGEALPADLLRSLDALDGRR